MCLVEVGCGGLLADDRVVSSTLFALPLGLGGAVKLVGELMLPLLGGFNASSVEKLLLPRKLPPPPSVGDVIGVVPVAGGVVLFV